MKEFPSVLKPKHKDEFKDLNHDRLKCYLRRDLYEHIISKDENDYFMLEEFNKRVNDMELTKQIVNEVIPELRELGWNCKTSFGGTALFIYSTEQPPVSCWSEE